MEEIICYTSRLEKGEKKNISFMDLLLDERLAEGILSFPQDIYNRIGDINRRLNAKQNYEFLLRAVSEYSLATIGMLSLHDLDAAAGRCHDAEAVIIDNSGQNEDPQDAWDGFRTDCYIAGKYQRQLLDAGFFNPVIETLLASASHLGRPETASSWLEKMISHAPEYYEIDDNTRPILVYLTSDTCCNTLNLFAMHLADGLRALRQRVDVFDIQKEGNQALTRFIGSRFKAVIGIQTYAFSIMMQDRKTNLHDLIIGPKYNMILDHPAWMKEHIENGPKDYYLLIHDGNYLAFAKRYYKNVKDCFHFYPAGILPDDTSSVSKIYDITFIGTWHDYRVRLALLKTYDRPYRLLAARFLHIMRHNPDYPAELALHQALEYYGIELCDADFLDLFYEMRQVCFCVMTYYREKVIHTLLDAGITIHVYGDSWQNSPFSEHKCLICHPTVTVAESLKIMSRSRISLNIMSWHKDGLTERIFNAMLCHSAVVSDRSTALENIFINGQYLLLFSLQQLDSLPLLIKDLLEDTKRQQELADNGYAAAIQKHQWINRAEQFLGFLQPDNI